MRMGGVHSGRYQRGQSSVFVVIFLGVMLFALVSLYQSGKLTSEKMQLQNAADAAAYSVSTIEARDMNFMSYINRAMVANEVAVGQMVSLMSWSRFLSSVPAFMRFYDKTILAGPTLGISTSIIEPIAGVWESIARTIESGLRIMARIGTKVLHVINKIYSVAQTGYHAMTVVFAVATLDEMIRNNSPPRYDASNSKIADGAKLSDFGIISLIGHLLSYGAIPKIQLPSISFTRTYFPNAPADGPGFERFAAITQEARDPFTRERGKTLDLARAMYGETDNGGPPLVSGWQLPLVPPIRIEDKWSADLGIASLETYLRFIFEINLSRKGGTELRHAAKPVGSKTYKRKNTKKKTGPTGSGYNWSAGDQVALEMLLEAALKITASFGIGELSAEGTLLDFEFSLDPLICRLEVLEIAGESLFSLSEIEDFLGFKLCPEDVAFRPGAPFGAGGAQAGAGAFKLMDSATKLSPNINPLGQVKPDHYGGAPKNIITWMWPPGVAPGAQGPAFDIPKNNVNRSYRGLPMYTDVADQVATPGFIAPYFIVGLVKDMSEYKKTGPDYDKSELKTLRTKYGAADDELAAVAKSEVYFSRPLDLDYFSRIDGQGEIGSAFNPFWQARLVDTSWSDRVASLLVQQKQEFTGFNKLFNVSEPGDLLDLFN